MKAIGHLHHQPTEWFDVTRGNEWMGMVQVQVQSGAGVWRSSDPIRPGNADMAAAGNFSQSLRFCLSKQ